MPNPIVSFDAAKFFGQSTKWELVLQGGAVAQGAVTLRTDGSLLYPDYFKGMRFKTTKHQCWMNLYPDGYTSSFISREDADRARNGTRIECRLIEWES